MKIDVLTLFPEMFQEIIKSSIIKRAIDKKKVSVNIINIRDFSTSKKKQVDDKAYGGGAGMVLMIEPIYNALLSLKKSDSYIVLLNPSSKTKYSQKQALRYSKLKHLIIICGHYEGVDERIKNFIDDEISIGDFILTGGELGSLIIIDSVVRLLHGVINEESLISESFNNNLLDYPKYTKPKDFMGYRVPEILLSGDHKKINEYNNKKRIEETKNKRPDLIEEE